MNTIKSTILTPLIFIILISSCSYQKMNSVDQKKFHIKEFEINGDTRESFIIQKKIQRFSNKESSNKIKILINLKKNKAIIVGQKELNGADCISSDLRTTFSIILGAIAAKGVTKIGRIYHGLRGYCDLEKKLKNIGIKITVKN